MGNYSGVLRTNYFRVFDEDQFEDLMDKVEVDDARGLEVTSVLDKDGERLYRFGGYGAIIGIPDASGNFGDDAYDNFLQALQNYVAVDDAIIIMEIGHEKLNDVYASATIVTCDDTDFIDLQDISATRAADLLSFQVM